jgi:hypothetical protein
VSIIFSIEGGFMVGCAAQSAAYAVLKSATMIRAITFFMDMEISGKKTRHSFQVSPCQKGKPCSMSGFNR